MGSRPNLAKLIERILSPEAISMAISEQTAQYLADQTRKLLMKEPILLEISGPINVIGDVHGQIDDLMRIFMSAGRPPGSRYLFLGDLVDRGHFSFEIVCLLFAMKLSYPDAIYFVRGNHETVEMSYDFGFYSECRKKSSLKVFKAIHRAFDCFSVGAVVNNVFLCVHGGLSMRMRTLDSLRSMTKPYEIDSLIDDILWSDPVHSDIETTGYHDSSRGNTFHYGREFTERFLQENGLIMIIRGHEMVHDGYEFPFPGKQVLTVFSASSYMKEANKAAYVSITTGNKYAITVMAKSKMARYPLNKM